MIYQVQSTLDGSVLYSSFSRQAAALYARKLSQSEALVKVVPVDDLVPFDKEVLIV